MSVSPNHLTDDERLEYQEINEFARHDDTVTLAVSSVLLPVLFAALAWAWVQSLVFEAPLALGSLVIWLYWAAVTQRRGDFADIRYRRALELECRAHLQHHLRIAWADGKQGFWLRWQRIKGIELVGSLMLISGWLWLLSTHFVSRPDVLGALGLAALVVLIVKVASSRNRMLPPCEEPKRRPAVTEAQTTRTN